MPHRETFLTSLTGPLGSLAARLGPSARRAAALALPLLVLWASGCSNEPAPRDTHAPIGDTGEISHFFYQMLLYLDAAILAVVASVWVWTLIKFKKRDGDDTLPEQNHGNIKLEVLWTAIPTLIVVAITLPMLAGVFKLAAKPDVNQRWIEVDVTGKQWWWEFDYRNDVAQGLQAANELHVPAGVAVTLNMTAADVMHAWWIPRLGGKRDATPGRSYPLHFTAKQAGVYDGQCAELCGASHALMGTKLVVHPLMGEAEVEYPPGSGKKVTLESYDTWAKSQLKPAAAPTAEIEKGLKVFKERTCPTCHIINGIEGTDVATRAATSGPNLTHLASRMAIAGNTLVNNTENLDKWIAKPSAIKPGSKMPDGLVPNDADRKALVAFLSSLK